MYIEGIVIGLVFIFETILIGRVIVRNRKMEKIEAEKRKDWRNAWV